MTEFIALQKARSIVKRCFDDIRKLDKFDPLRNQASRSAVSVVSNLAEGNERQGKDRNHLFVIAKGSLAELNEQMILIITHNRQSTFTDAKLFEDIQELHKIIYSLSRSPSPSGRS